MIITAFAAFAVATTCAFSPLGAFGTASRAPRASVRLEEEEDSTFDLNLLKCAHCLPDQLRKTTD